jgi:general secretion pathway protein K
MKHRQSSDARASALLLVMWALLVLSAAVLAWAEWIQNDLVLHGDANRAVEARAMAHSGAAVALHPLVSLRTSLRAELLAPGMGYEVRMISEGGKLNVNWLLQGEEPQKLAIFKRWLERRGLGIEERETLVDSLLDYMDADSLRRLNGMEDKENYQPRNRELQSVEEIARVWGAAPLTAQAGWDHDLTVFSQGPIDLSSASAEILRLLPGLSETRLLKFVQVRRGPDDTDGTEDDYLFQNLAAVQQALGLTAAQFQELAKLTSANDPTLLITSSGHSGKVTRKVEVVARKEGAHPHILSWKE